MGLGCVRDEAEGRKAAGREGEGSGEVRGFKVWKQQAAQTPPFFSSQELSSSPTSFSSSAVASQCSSWRWHWASTAARGVLPLGGRSVPSSKVSVILPASSPWASHPACPCLFSCSQPHLPCFPLLCCMKSASCGPKFRYPVRRVCQEKRYRIVGTKLGVDTWEMQPGP